MGNNSDPNYQSISTRADNDGRQTEALRVSIHDHSTKSESHAAPRFGPNDTGAAMLAPIERQIENLKGLLAASNGFDQHTGAVRYVHAEGSEHRTRLQRELVNLEGFTLPLTRIRAAEADAYHASRPTQTQKLEAQLQRRDSIEDRAQAIVDEREAQAKAARILRQRGSGLSIG